jgi:pimeloyl-ACP methyl ester carboxylesterase
MRSVWGAAILVVVLVFLTVLGTTTVRVYGKTHPGGHDAAPLDFEAMEISVEPVRFSATDGVSLEGWLMRGSPERQAVLLCHDLGGSKASLANVAIALREAGFTVLMFDFRGHGESGGDSSTLGLSEKRDVIGATEFLQAQEEIDTARIGVYGVGMGAHAAVLAAGDVPELRVLVLDSLYPDAAFPLVRDVFARWSFAERYLGFIPRTVFAALYGTRIGTNRAADVIGRLPGRDMLLLAPAGDSALTEEMERMYRTIPDHADADGNMVILPATQGSGLYAEQFERYQKRVSAFFDNRLSGI